MWARGNRSDLPDCTSLALGHLLSAPRRVTPFGRPAPSRQRPVVVVAVVVVVVSVSAGSTVVMQHHKTAGRRLQAGALICPSVAPADGGDAKTMMVMRMRKSPARSRWRHDSVSAKAQVLWLALKLCQAASIVISRRRHHWPITQSALASLRRHSEGSFGVPSLPGGAATGWILPWRATSSKSLAGTIATPSNDGRPGWLSSAGATILTPP